VGALAAPLAGRLADRSGPERVTRLGAGLVVVSFAAMALAPLMASGAQIWLLVACAVGFDLGVQAALVAHQSIVYGIDPGARSRLNAVLFTGMFVGMAIGSALGAALLAQWGWIAVVVLATGSALAAFAVRLGSR
jgi:MFS family permease